jgi:SAM-dependent methyltransferase
MGYRGRINKVMVGNFCRMEKAEYLNVFENEHSHFYYVTVWSLFEKLVRKFTPVIRPTILDAGCGTGGMSTRLSQFGKVRAVDIDKHVVALAKSRGVNAQVGSVVKLPFRNASFDIVISIDVLVSVKDDLKALREMSRVLKKNGILIIRLSAHNYLATGHDRVVKMVRRYEVKELRSKLLSTGFSIIKMTYVNFALWPIQFLSSRMDHKKTSNIYKTNRLINWVVSIILSIETEIILRLWLPEGIGIVCVAKKDY